MNQPFHSAPSSAGCLSRRALLQAGAALVLPIRIQAQTAGPRLRLIGETTVAHWQPFADTLIGGLSGLDFNPANGQWHFICDDSVQGPARLYTARLPFGPAGLQAPVWEQVLLLRQPAGQPYARRLGLGPVVDPESVRWRGDAGTWLWTSEGDSLRGEPPALIESAPDGREVRRFALPAMFEPGFRQGPRPNRSLESLALTPDGTQAWTAMEGPLWQDGPPAQDGQAGGACRLTCFDLATGKATRQAAYLPDGVDGNGVVEILFDGPDHLLVLERAWSAGRGNTVQLYRVSVRDSPDVLHRPVIEGDVVMRKQRVADFAELGLSRLDNTEGMAWGPPLTGGARSLFFVSDDNFNPGQITQIAAFAYLD